VHDPSVHPALNSAGPDPDDFGHGHLIGAAMVAAVGKPVQWMTLAEIR
jgi:hypothetical protein